jgi:hypothetical protein
MKHLEEELTHAVTPSAVAAVHALTAGRWASDIVGVAAELGLADQIQSAPKTAEEIAAALGLHAPSFVKNSHEPQFAKILDIWMLAHLRGKERTLPEWRNLLSAGGFRLSSTFPTTTFASVIEATRE